MSNILPVTDESFTTNVIDSSGVTVVDFWAEWCGPCKSMTPLLEQLAYDKRDRIKVMKMNVDESLETPSRYGIRGIPTLMVFKDGQVTSTKVGVLSKSQLYRWIDTLL